jgi:hypothetical protein
MEFAPTITKSKSLGRRKNWRKKERSEQEEQKDEERRREESWIVFFHLPRRYT